MRNTLFITTVILLTGCFSAKVASSSSPSQKDVERVQSKFPDYTLTELNQGKSLYEQHCASCHDLKSPASQPEEKWRQIVPRMSAKVNKKENNVLDPSKQELILKYVITMSGSAAN